LRALALLLLFYVCINLILACLLNLYLTLFADPSYGFGLSANIVGSYTSMGAPVVWDMMVVRNRSYYYSVLLNFQPIPHIHSPTFPSPLRSLYVTPSSCPDYA